MKSLVKPQGSLHLQCPFKTAQACRNNNNHGSTDNNNNKGTKTVVISFSTGKGQLDCPLQTVCLHCLVRQKMRSHAH